MQQLYSYVRRCSSSVCHGLLIMYTSRYGLQYVRYNNTLHVVGTISFVMPGARGKGGWRLEQGTQGTWDIWDGQKVTAVCRLYLPAIKGKYFRNSHKRKNNADSFRMTSNIPHDNYYPSSLYIVLGGTMVSWCDRVCMRCSAPQTFNYLTLIAIIFNRWGLSYQFNNIADSE